MAKRKTVKIAHLVAEVNRKNQLSTCSAEVRQGWNSMLSTILMDADVYAGFNYLGTPDVPEGQLPGILFANAEGIELTPSEYFARLDKCSSERMLKGLEHAPANGDTKAFPDESRRVYFIHSAIMQDYHKVIVSPEYRAKFPSGRGR